METIQSYQIQLEELGSVGEIAKTITISGGGTKSHVVSQLKPATEYSVFIVPFSSTSLLRPSSLKFFKTKEDGKILDFIKTFQSIFKYLDISVPDQAPTNVQMRLVNSTTAMVSWVAPVLAALHGDMTGYKVEILANNTMVTNFTLEPRSRSLMLNNITTDVIYSVRLAAFNR